MFTLWKGVENMLETRTNQPTKTQTLKVTEEKTENTTIIKPETETKKDE